MMLMRLGKMGKLKYGVPFRKSVGNTNDGLGEYKEMELEPVYQPQSSLKTNIYQISLTSSFHRSCFQVKSLQSYSI